MKHGALLMSAMHEQHKRSRCDVKVVSAGAPESGMSTVIVIGPAADQIGGMSSVVSQIVSMDFGNRLRVELFPVTLAPGGRESPWKRVARHLRQARLLRARIRRTGASVVHIHTCSGFSFYRAALDMLVAQWMGCCVILHIHGAAFDAFYAGETGWRRNIIAWSLARADRVVALSRGWRDKLQGMALRASVVVIENAIELPATVAAQRRDDVCRFLLLARMDEWKGIDDLLQAGADLHREGIAIEIVLAGPPGTAGDATELERKILANELAGVVRYVGPVHGEKKSGLMAWTDVYVQPSHHEGMPIAMLEALAGGLPIVGTRVGAVPEMIEEGRQGLLVPPRRPDLLAAAMRDMARDHKSRLAMSFAARRLAHERFSISRLRSDLVSLYGSVMDSRAAGFRLRGVPARAEAGGSDGCVAYETTC